MKIEIRVELIKCASYFMAKKDVRTYLNGMLFESRPGITTVVSTDGSSMFAGRQQTLDEHDNIDFIVPEAAISEALKIKHNHRFLTFDTDAWTISVAGRTVPFTPIDGRYPKWKELFHYHLTDKVTIPNPLKPIFIAFSQLEKVYKACLVLNRYGNPVNYSYRETVNLYVIEAGSMIAICMPVRSPNDGIRFDEYAWLTS